MKASRNELIALFKQAFEGVGFDLGGYENAADMIVWAQMHGLNSFETVRKRMPTYDQRKQLSAERLTPEIINSDEKTNSVIDAKGNSSIVAAGMAFDISYVKAIKNEVASTSVLNCFDRKLAIKKLVDCSKRGVVCFVYWHDGETLHLVSSDTGVSYPEYSQCQLKDMWQESGKADFLNDKHKQSLFVVCASKAEDLQEYLSKNLPKFNENKTIVMSPAMMEANYSDTLTSGIVIDSGFWKELAILGQEVLVESTELSKMGAGA